MSSSLREKNPRVVEGEDGFSTDGEDLQWTPEEEAKLLRKVDVVVMPLLVASFFVLQLDRGNISNALTDSFLANVGITQNQYNIGQQLLSVGIVLLEIPSNLVLHRFGPTLWIGGQIIAWGLVATFQAFQHGLGAFLSTRLLLGLCEAGFIPASLFTLSRWYKHSEISKRFSIFFLGNLLGLCFSSLIAFGVLRMRGVAGLTGWQWMFILEGIVSVLVGITFLLAFPTSVSKPTSLLGVTYFSERESQILYQRVIRDDPAKATYRNYITRQELIDTFKNWRIFPHFAMTICALAPIQAIGSYAPTLIASFGFGTLDSNALASVGYWCLLVVIQFIGWGADRTRLRGPWVLATVVLGLVFNIADRAVIDSGNKNLRFGLLVASVAVSWAWHPVNGSWLSLNAKSQGERSITMAIHIMSANLSGIIGGQIFRSDDAPLYHRGWTVIVILSSLATFFALWANIQYWWLNGRRFGRGSLKWYS
ncbi:major facilitator superfamily domain-containing protein [Xylariales sp. PMI_506]|nr:major facilitator superfamily domain-containing protein [Xylariales sp. PMI_506]